MRIRSGYIKLFPSVLSGALGIALFIYGGQDDSPGAQLLGAVILVISLVVMFRTRRKIVCEIKN